MVQEPTTGAKTWRPSAAVFRHGDDITKLVFSAAAVTRGHMEGTVRGGFDGRSDTRGMAQEQSLASRWRGFKAKAERRGDVTGVYCWYVATFQGKPGQWQLQLNMDSLGRRIDASLAKVDWDAFLAEAAARPLLSCRHFHPANAMVRPAGLEGKHRVALLDWEMVGIGSGPQEIGFMLSHYRPEERAKVERSMVRSYYDHPQGSTRHQDDGEEAGKSMCSVARESFSGSFQCL